MSRTLQKVGNFPLLITNTTFPSSITLHSQENGIIDRDVCVGRTRLNTKQACFKFKAQSKHNTPYSTSTI